MSGESSTCRTIARAVGRDAPGVGAGGAGAGDGSFDGVNDTTAEHAQHCARCAAVLRRRGAVQKLALAHEDRLDDVTRSRVLARLTNTIDQVTSRRVRGFGRWTPRLSWSLGFVAVAVVAFAVRLSLWNPSAPVPPSAPSPVASASVPSPATGPGSSPTAGPADVLAPYASPAAAASRGATLGRTLDRLEVPARATMRARLADVAELTLVGPLALAVTSADQDRVELELGRGTLVGDYDGSRGGKLRVRAGDVTVEITGTLFAVARDADGTRVSVAHGKVRVEGSQQIVEVTDNQSWSTRRQVLEPVPPSVSVLFEQASRGLHQEAEPAARSAGKRASAGRAERVDPVEAGPRKREDRRTRRNAAASARVSRRKLALHAPEPAPDLVREAPPPAPQPSPADVPPSPPVEVPRPAPAGMREPAPPAPPPVPAPIADSAERTPPPQPAAPPQPAFAPPPVQVTPSSLYRQAERALQRGDESGAHKTLAEIISRFPGDPMADAARFELALLLQKAGKRRQALALADELGHDGREGPFVEPARFLRCRLEAERHQRAAALSCLAHYIEAHPSSPHHGQALQLSIELHHGGGDCAKTSELADRYLASHPRGPFAARAKELKGACAAK